MSGWSPPELSGGVVAGFAFVSALILAYAVLIQGSFLLGLLPVVLFGFGYLVWRAVAAVEAVADGVQRIADERERR
jgi:threonine/homoserine/homoserine lactone efflux protein